ncbi:transposase, partial [Streptomyces sp. NPDC005181]|uniref:transposase n=1 Tax=Streptomyces sp. NPDC005181 TaxID=3156869 RepID=UPI0033A069B1
MGAPLHGPLTSRPWSPGDLARRSQSSGPLTAANRSQGRKRYTSEFKRDAVALVRSSGRNVTEVARELGV